jgi:cyclic pyranopterin phosphate synthase
MPHDGIEWKKKEELLTYSEIERIAKVFVNLGVKKIRLTGGEPLVRKDLEILIGRLSDLAGVETLAMTTNGTLLADKAALLRRMGLKALNISLDTFRRDRFYELTRRDDFEAVTAGLNAALSAGFDTLKLNCVVMSGFNDDEILDFVDFAYKKLINVRFIEYMPFKDNEWQIEKVVSFAQMREQIEQKYRLQPLPAEPGAVAKDFAIEGGMGSVSFISSMSDSFCGTCNRLRLTADGSVKSCLFYASEISLRDRLRAGATDRELEDMIQYALSIKPEAHPPAEEIEASKNRSMIEIGG